MYINKYYNYMININPLALAKVDTNYNILVFCRSANYNKETRVCELSDMDRHTTSSTSSIIVSSQFNKWSLSIKRYCCLEEYRIDI